VPGSDRVHQQARLACCGGLRPRPGAWEGEDSALAFARARGRRSVSSCAASGRSAQGGIAQRHRSLLVLADGRSGLAKRSQGNRAYILAGQRGKDLGERLRQAFHRMLRRHWRVLVIGTDSPELSPRVLRQALDELLWCDAVLGPCPDGGYYLIGLRRFRKGLFHGVRWGTRFAFGDTLRNLIEGHFSCSILEPLLDIDRPGDFYRLSKRMSRSPQLRRLAPATWSFVNQHE